MALGVSHRNDFPAKAGARCRDAVFLTADLALGEFEHGVRAGGRNDHRTSMTPASIEHLVHLYR